MSNIWVIRNLSILLCAALFCSGCARRTVVRPETVTNLTITSTKETNNGAPLYVVLKFTDFPHFLVDDYLTIAHLSEATDQDSSTCMSICLIPGRTERRISNPPAGLATGIYCLFTECGEQWKYLIDPADGCQEVVISLGEHEINSVEMR